MHYLRLSVLCALAVITKPLDSAATPFTPNWNDMHTKHRWNAIPGKWESIGQSPVGTTIDLRIALKPHREHPLTDAIYEEQVARLVAPHSHTLKLVESWLGHHGVAPSNVSTSHGGNWLTVTGVPVSKANDLLGASYQLSRYAGTNETILRTASYALPAALRVHVQTVAPTMRFGSPLTPRKRPRGHRGLAAAALSTRDVLVTPAVLRSLYNSITYQPAATEQNMIGVTGFLGQYVGDEDLEDFMRVYRSDANDPTFLVVDINDRYDPNKPGEEPNPDMQYTQGIAWPTPHVFYSVGGLPGEFVPDSYKPTISTSYGGDEQNFPPDNAMSLCDFSSSSACAASAYSSRVVTEVLAEVLAAGSARGTTAPALSNSSPSSLRHVPGSPALAERWNAAQIAAPLSGGFSNVFERPVYQTDAVLGFFQKLRNQHSGLYNGPSRGFPDLAAQAVGCLVIVDDELEIMFPHFRLDQMRPELNSVLQCLYLNGYSVFSLIDDILAHGCNQEDPGIKLLREGVERDAENICARLLNHNPTSSSVSSWALGFAQATLRTFSLWNNNVVPPGFPSGIAWTSTGGPERLLNTGRVLFKNYRYGATIDMLPDNVLLEIFDFCLRDSTEIMFKFEVILYTRQWQILVHVCQGWRRIIFESPRRLDLHLCCSYRIPVRRNLGFWPISLPLTVDYPCSPPCITPEDEDSIITALSSSSRVHRIDILASGPLMRKVTAMMQTSFAALTHLDLACVLKDLPAPSPRDVPPVIPGRFMGGSAPRLQYFRLKRVSFPQLPTFLLSARNLVTLKVKDMYQNGYISPEAVVGSLAVLTRLRTLSISLEMTSPSLRSKEKGYSEYLEDFLVQIDTPRVDDLRIEYFTHQIQALELSRFIDRTENLKLDQFSRADVTFYRGIVDVELNCSQGKCHQARLFLEILDQPYLNTQVPCVSHVLYQLVPTFSNVDHLYAHGGHVSRQMNVANWLPFFRLFLAVETLHLSGGVAAYITSALEDGADSEEMTTNVFPALHLIWLGETTNFYEDSDCDEPVGPIERFLSSRQLSGRPVTVVDTEGEFNRRC
ncbi:hypothetical protein EDB84DRAFT_1577534 [Lactarius hengduanensis]|nr:hypothetical protein EDB84DRAFT_1577534 [Lactarius hengduanensis]